MQQKQQQAQEGKLQELNHTQEHIVLTG
jgi:hypothetical protein